MKDFLDDTYREEGSGSSRFANPKRVRELVIRAERLLVKVGMCIFLHVHILLTFARHASAACMLRVQILLPKQGGASAACLLQKLLPLRNVFASPISRPNVKAGYQAI